MPEAIELLGLSGRSIVAPAGHGKTELITKVAALGRRTLVLTHTHAGVHAIKGRLKRLGISSSVVVVDTIASWASRYAYAFPQRSNVPAGGRPTGNQWNLVYEGAAAILQSAVVRRVIEASYERILIDEYQDCDGLQHALATALSAVVPTLVFGDAMQGIFEFVDTRIRWRDTVLPVFSTAHELTEPHRWRTVNPDLGSWIAEVRRKLMVGEPIDLRKGPITYLPCSDAFDMGLFFDGIDERQGSTAAIHCVRKVCNGLAQATRGAFQSIEEIAAARLIAFAQAWDDAQAPTNRREALGSLMHEAIVRSDHVPEEGIDPNLNAALNEAWAALGTTGLAVDAINVLRQERAHPQSRTFRGDLLGDAKRALGEVAAGRHTSLVAAAEAMRQRLSHTGRATLRRTVSTPLLLKGLEFDHVVVPDATHFLSQRHAQAKLFYVAISRARSSLTIASRTPTLQFTLPTL